MTRKRKKRVIVNNMIAFMFRPFQFLKYPLPPEGGGSKAARGVTDNVRAISRPIGFKFHFYSVF